MGLRKVLFIIGGATFACLLICVAVFLIGIRAARNSVHDDVANAISSAVAQQISTFPRSSDPVTIEITAEDVAREIAQQYSDDGADVDDILIEFNAPDQLVIGLSPEGRDIVYTATLDAENGELVVTDIDGNIRAVELLLPAGRVGDAIEDGVNSELLAQNYILQSIRVTSDRLILTIEPAPTSS